MLSHSSSTEAMLCVENNMVCPLSRNSNISRLSSLAFTGSKPLNGSSKISKGGSCSTVVMNCTFCCIPFESSSSFRCHQGMMSNFSNQYFSLCLASRSLSPFSRARYTACSPTFIFLYRPRSSGKYPMRIMSASQSRCPSKVTLPSSATVMWLMIRMSVVFPAPLGPSSPNTFPSGTRMPT